MKRLLKDIRQSIRTYGVPPRLSDYDFLEPEWLRPRPEGRPLVSVVTCVLNAAETLPRTMESVRAQTWPELEYVVVDGGSTDGTAEIIAANVDIVSARLSGNDDGLYDAFNRGVAISTGDYVAVLNADDWMEPDHIAKSVGALGRSGADFSFGDVVMHEPLPDGTMHPRFRGADRDYAATLPTGSTELHHASMLVGREVFETVGLFRTGLKITADYDWYIRLHKAGYRGVYSGVTAHMAHGGISTTRQELSILEASFVAWKNGGPPLGILRFWGPMMAKRMAWRGRQFLSDTIKPRGNIR